MRRKSGNFFYMPPGHGHERRKRNLRYLMLAIIVGVVASSRRGEAAVMEHNPRRDSELPNISPQFHKARILQGVQL